MKQTREIVGSRIRHGACFGSGACWQKCNPRPCSASKRTASAPKSTSPNGLPGFNLVGLGAGARQRGQRARACGARSFGLEAAAAKSDREFGAANVRKDGAAFDLPIAVGVLAAQEIVPRGALEGILMLGELSLDGSLRRVAGGLPVAMFARELGAKAVILPTACAAEAAAIREVPVLAASSLPEVAAYLRGEHELLRVEELRVPDKGYDDVDLSDVRGQEYVKLALEVRPRARTTSY